MKTIILNGKRGGVALVSDKDYRVMSSVSWQKDARGYARRTLTIRQSRVTIFMHREVINAKKGQAVDHINGNKLDNRRINLRTCTQSQNMANMRVHKNKYKGVSYNKKRGKWEAQIHHQYKHIFLGYFDDIKEAALAYNKKSREIFGRFAYVNTI